jgi:hypothetical protein
MRLLAALYRERDSQRARAKQRDPASATNSRGPGEVYRSELDEQIADVEQLVSTLDSAFPGCASRPRPRLALPIRADAKIGY